MFGIFRSKKKSSDATPSDEEFRQCNDLLYQYANICYEQVHSLIGGKVINDQEKSFLVSKTSIVFFRQLCRSLCQFCSVSDSIAFALTSRILSEYFMPYADKTTLAQVEPIFCKTMEQFRDRQIAEKTVAAWAGNMVAAEMYHSQEINTGLIATYVEGICHLKMRETKDADLNWRISCEMH